MNRIATATVAIIGLMASMAVTTPAAADVIRDFESNVPGQSPPGIVVPANGGYVHVESVTRSEATSKAMRVKDFSTASQTRVQFPDTPAGAKRYAFDLTQEGTDPTIVAVGGEGYSDARGMYRFLLAHGTGTTARVSVYNSSTYVQLGLAPGVYDNDRWTPVEILATRHTARLTIGSWTVTTTAHASPVPDAGSARPTLLEFASAGASQKGNFAVDNIAVAPATDPGTYQSVATESGGREGRFPSVARLADGRLIAVYNSSTEHRGFHPDANGDPVEDGYIRAVFTQANGTWGNPTTIISHLGAGDPDDENRPCCDDHDPKVTVLSNGEVLVSYHRLNWDRESGSITKDSLGVYISRFAATANDLTLLGTTKVHTAESGKNYFGHGNAIEIQRSDPASPPEVLLPFYGGGARVARSTDGGRTFTEIAQAPVLPNCTFSGGAIKINYEEPGLVALPPVDGVQQIVMVIRTRRIDVNGSNEINGTVMRSIDGGTSWSSGEHDSQSTCQQGLETVSANLSSHHLALTSDGSALLTYGQWDHIDTDVTPARPTMGMLIPNPGAVGAFNGGDIPTHLVDTAPSGDIIQKKTDQANPSSIETSPGKFLTLTYDVHRARIIGIETSAASYG